MPLTERINECLEAKATHIKEKEESKYQGAFVPATNERSKVILKQRDQRLEIERHLEEDMKDLIRRKTVQLSLPGYMNVPKEEIFLGDRNKLKEDWRRHHKKPKDHKYPNGATEEIIKKNFMQDLSRIASRSRSLR